MRVVFARCSVEYAGRLSTRLPEADRLLMIKSDGSLLIHAETTYKPLNWMTTPAASSVEETAEGQVWTFMSKSDETLTLTIYEVYGELSRDLGLEPGLDKDGVEADLQRLLALHPDVLGSGLTLVRREYPTAIGPVDLLCRSDRGGHVAIEVKRRGEVSGVAQLERYLDLLNRDPLLVPVAGVFAAQEIRPQARIYAADRGIRCVTVDYEALKGADDPSLRLF